MSRATTRDSHPSVRVCHNDYDERPSMARPFGGRVECGRPLTPIPVQGDEAIHVFWLCLHCDPH